jgi:uncharacterized protein YdeI (YjbR/CyaY-like superfamily)
MAADDGSEPIYFETEEELRAWLEANHATESELIVGMWKKHTGRASVHWPEVRDAALCFGWIDGIARRIDDERHQQRITPRKDGSIWSKVNVERFDALEAEGRMTDAGRAAFAKRREDRTGVYSHERDEEPELPAGFEARLRANAKAAAFFDAQPPGYRRTAIHLVISAKREETRERRLEQLIADSAAGLRIKQLRR